GDRAVAGALNARERHHLEQRADVQARRGRIETDVARERAGRERVAHALGAVIDHFAPRQLFVQARSHARVLYSAEWYNTPMPAERAPLLTAAAALGALSLSVAAFIPAPAAPAPPHYFAQDQQVYLAIARAPFSDDPQVHHASGSWRLLPPLLARYIGMPLGGPERGFLVLTFSMFALLPGACLAWLASLGASRASAIACAAVIAIAPPVVGLLAWDVVRVDAVGLLLLFLAATAAVRGRGAWLLAMIAAMALTKETALLGAGFAVAWAACVDRRMLPAAALAASLAVAIRSFLQWWI